MSILSGRVLMVLDTETTGFDPAQGHELIEVARVTIDDGKIGEEWSSLIRPSRPIPPDASAVHGITDAMTASAPAPARIAARLRRDCAGHPLVFHNAPFDLPFLRALLRGAGVAAFDAPVVDTLGLARGVFGAGGNSLSALARRLSLPGETAHRALGDARTTARVLLVLAARWERERGVGSLEELAASSQDQVRLTNRNRPGAAAAAPGAGP
ncbi:MAG: 3'-5' exonuclease [Candidatus Eisenbacteria bacterium]|nr:3'-5' exonuclease [Candidatus Eisenbacteria bacterium]